jgi:guanyl-specific ribonuclease Sa
MNIIRALELLDALGSALPGTKGGGTFQNDGRGGGDVLPKTDADGQAIKYREWDVNPPGPGGRDAERIVKGSDGSPYYTPDHYKTFRKIR